MLSENQIRTLLDYCESKIGTTLSSLRKRLLRHNKPDATIWELVWIYWALQIGKVRPESHAASADLEIQLSDCTYRIEVATIQANDRSVSIVQPVTVINEHPIYRTICRKAKQIRAFGKKDTSPIFLAICVNHEDGNLGLHTPRGVTPRAAIQAAFYDSHVNNLLKEHACELRPPGKNLRIDATKYLSGVIFVHLSTPIGSYGGFNKVPNAEIFLNLSCINPANNDVIKSLTKINMGKLTFSPGWDDWDQTDKGNRQIRLSKRITKGIELSHKKFVFPQTYLLQLLAGELDSTEFLVGKDYDLRVVFKKALVDGQDIVAVRLLDTEVGRRGEPDIEITLGDPGELVIAVPKTKS